MFQLADHRSVIADAVHLSQGITGWGGKSRKGARRLVGSVRDGRQEKQRCKRSAGKAHEILGFFGSKSAFLAHKPQSQWECQPDQNTQKIRMSQRLMPKRIYLH